MSGWLSVAITVILVVVAYIILNRNITARTSQQAALDDIKREVGAIITELNSTTERNIELIEDRIATLERLVEQADKRVGVLRREAATHRSEPATYTKLGSPAIRSSDSGPARRAGAAAEPPPEEPRVGSGGRPAEPEPAPNEGSLRERVRALYLQGLPLARIASIVGKTVGEVELIVSLDEGAER
ncbi:MAG: hypothetical protein ACOC2Y_04235 [Spirochaetota bacterium]